MIENKETVSAAPDAAAEPKSAKQKNTKSDKQAAPRTHVVARGDTIRGISKRYYGTPRRAEEIRVKNRLATDHLRIGRKLILPD